MKMKIFLIVLSLLSFLGGCEEYALLDQYQLYIQGALVPAPENFTVNGATGNTQTIEISWSHPDVSAIDGFWLMRKNSTFNTYELVANESSLGRNETYFLDTNRTPNLLYTYRMFAVSQGYLSLSTQEIATFSNIP